MMQTIFFVFSLAVSAFAYSITSVEPASGTNITSGDTVVISFTTVSSDPTSFSVALVNEVIISLSKWL